jgi:NAD(P)-dependent dehydrogenase (short-subunit alcohol dehydrogenase family)
MLPLAEQTVLVTGATDGLGRALAERIAAEGATVLVHGRDPNRTDKAVREIQIATGNRRVSAVLADFADLTEVRMLADQVCDGHDRLDVLVNNAGIGATVPGDGKRQESTDGHELRFQVNYLAGFLLTRLLLDRLVAADAARIVHVSSVGQAAIDFDDVMLERDYGGVRAYCQSKLAQIMFTFDLADELVGTNVTATALHPASYMPTKIVDSPMSTISSGVAATMRLVSAPELAGVTGRYFNQGAESRAVSQAYDRSARDRLRELSEQLTGLPTTRPAQDHKLTH